MSKSSSSEEERQRNPVPPYRRPRIFPSVEAAKTINVSRNPNIGEAVAGCKPLFQETCQRCGAAKWAGV